MARLLLLACLSAAMLTAQSGAGLSGHVADRHGQSVSKVTLELKPVANGPQIDPRAYRVESGPRGEFQFDEIDPGSYTFSATKSGYLPWTYGATRGSPAPKSIHLASGKPLEGMAIQLTPAAAVSGRVLDGDGEPAAAYVVISKEQYEDGVRTLVDVGGARPEAEGDGRYRISGLPAGHYFISARPPGQFIPTMGGGYIVINGGAYVAAAVNGAARPQPRTSNYATTYYSNALRQSDAKPIDITAGQELTGVDIQLQRAAVFSVHGNIDGVVPGVPASQYRIVLTALGRMSSAGGPVPPNIQPDGTFEIPEVPPGDYSLTVMPGTLGFGTPIAMQKMTVGNHNADGVVLALRPLSSIQGRMVLKQGGKLVPEATVTLISSEDSLVRYKSTMKDGQFTIAAVPRGTYRVAVSGNPADTYLESNTILEVTFDAQLDFITLTLAPGGHVHGSASPFDTITLVPDPPRPTRPDWYRQAVADNDGQFELDGVPPGTYRALAWADIEPGEWFDPEFSKKHLGQSVPLIVREDTSVEIKLTEIPAAP